MDLTYSSAKKEMLNDTCKLRRHSFNFTSSLCTLMSYIKRHPCIVSRSGSLCQSHEGTVSTHRLLCAPAAPSAMSTTSHELNTGSTCPRISRTSVKAQIPLTSDDETPHLRHSELLLVGTAWICMLHISNNLRLQLSPLSSTTYLSPQARTGFE